MKSPSFLSLLSIDPFNLHLARTISIRDHRAPAVALAGLGYHLLLEKPMAVTEADCIAIRDACSANNVHL